MGRKIEKLARVVVVGGGGGGCWGGGGLLNACPPHPSCKIVLLVMAAVSVT